MSYSYHRLLTPYNYSKGNSGRKYIVCHYTGNVTDTARANASYFYTGNRGASAHFFVDDSTVYEVVSPENTAWAVGKKFGNAPYWGKCTNSNSLSVEMCSRNGRITNATFDNAVELVKKLMKQYNIPASRVIRHWDVCAKRCVGWTGWLPPNESIWQKFKKAIAEKDPAPTPTPTPTEGDIETMLPCTFQIDGKTTVYWFDGQIIRSLTHADQLKVIQDIYKANTGRKLPHFKWTSKAPYYLRLQEAISRPAVHFDDKYPEEK